MLSTKGAPQDYRLGSVRFGYPRFGIEQGTPEGFRTLKPVLLDTGVIVAWLDRREQFHSRATELVDRLSAPLVTSESVITEACYLLRKVPGASEAVIANVEAGTLQIPLRLAESAGEVRKMLRKYSDRSIDLADASLIWLASALGSGDILTLDADFRVYRWSKNNPFRLLIPLD
jgi:predicted nucleic acid-binding protein